MKFVLVCSVALVGFYFVIAAVECSARWQDSGRKYEWSVFAGCRVEDKSGKLIPEANIRDIQ